MQCPNCGSKMVKRTAKKGPYPGSTFWGCTRWPACKGLVSISKAEPSPSGPGTNTPVGGPSDGQPRTWNRRGPSAPTPPRPMAEPEQRLINYYIACIEAEGRQELLLEKASLGTRFVSLSSQAERLLSGADGDWKDLGTTADVADFVRRGSMGSRSERMLYGYPIVVHQREGKAVAAPLFFCEIDATILDDDKGQRPAARPSSAAIQTSLAALELLGIDRAERLQLVEALESSEDGSILARLDALAKGGLISAEWDLSAPLQPLDWTTHSVQRSAVLFMGERAVFTLQLLADLEDLARVPVSSLKSGPLGAILGRKSLGSDWPEVRPQPGIVPTNFSQDQAITAALSRTLAVITGPPGTGKSQVLVNAVAAALEAGESVLFASKNNQAVDVVFNRISSVSSEAVTLRAGNKAKRAEVGQKIIDALNRETTVRGPLPETRPTESWAKQAEGLEDLYRLQGERARIEQQLVALYAREDEAFRSIPSDLRLLDPANQVEIGQFLSRLESLLKQVRKKTLFSWLFKARRRRLEAEATETWDALRSRLPRKYAASLSPGIPQSFSDLKFGLSKFAGYLETRTALTKVVEQLAALPDREASSDRLVEMQPERLTAGRALFAWNWSLRIRGASGADRTRVSTFANSLLATGSRKFGAGALEGVIASVIRMFPVWGVTNLSARTNFPLRRDLFDLVIIDEASQCDIPSALPLLYRAKRAMIIGDRHQLIHVSSLRERHDEELARSSKLTEGEFLDLGYRTVSLFDVAARRIDEQPLFLDEHYRSREAIIRFSNDLFYGSRLLIRSPESTDEQYPAVSWIHVDGVTERGRGGRSYMNPPEAEEVARVLSEIRSRNEDGSSIGVVTPFAAQANLIRDRVSGGPEDLTIATAHRFQGDERDVMIFSPVLSRTLPEVSRNWVNDSHLINVAVTRARRQLVIVGDRQACLAAGGVMGQLAQYSQDLLEGEFDSPLERRMFQALESDGLSPKVGVTVKGYRLDIALERGEVRIDVECDGAVYHRDARRDSIRDQALSDAGWKVVRLPGREIISDLDSCVSRVRQLL